MPTSGHSGSVVHEWKSRPWYQILEWTGSAKTLCGKDERGSHDWF
jgi:hypothetical protein